MPGLRGLRVGSRPVDGARGWRAAAAALRSRFHGAGDRADALPADLAERVRVVARGAGAGEPAARGPGGDHDHGHRGGRRACRRHRRAQGGVLRLFAKEAGAARASARTRIVPSSRKQTHAMPAVAQNDVLYVLTVVTTCIIPLQTFSGICQWPQDGTTFASHPRRPRMSARVVRQTG